MTYKNLKIKYLDQSITELLKRQSNDFLNFNYNYLLNLINSKLATIKDKKNRKIIIIFNSLFLHNESLYNSFLLLYLPILPTYNIFHIVNFVLQCINLTFVLYSHVLFAVGQLTLQIYSFYLFGLAFVFVLLQFILLLS